MAYSVQSPGRSGVGQGRSRPQVTSGYKSALTGFTGSINNIRKQLIADQAARIDYEIEVGAASTSDKVAMYEEYLTQLEEGTSEWYRVSTKIQNLKDTAASMDTAMTKKLYSLNQISGEEYYSFLRERAAEPGISQQEKMSRLLELASFEKEAATKKSEQALREAATQESLGMISALERYEIIEQAFNNETDPDRRSSLQLQLISQQRRVYDNELDLRELQIRRGIQQGTATTADLLAIQSMRVQMAATPQEALQAEITYQNTFEKVQNEQAALYSKGSKAIKDDAVKRSNALDRKIEDAKRNGEVATVALLYSAKEQLITEFMSNPNVSDDDRQVGKFFDFYENVLGRRIDPDTFEVTEVPPSESEAYNINRVNRPLADPASSGLLKVYGEDGGVVGYELVRGEQVPMPDGSIGYDYGKNNIYVRNKQQEITLPDGTTQTISLPELVRATDAPYAVSSQLRGNRDVKFTGQTVILGQVPDEQGNLVDQIGYIVEGKRAGDYVGTTPIPGQPDRFIFTPFNGRVPTESDLVRKPEALGPVVNTAANVQEFINRLSPIDETIAGIRRLDPKAIADVAKTASSATPVLSSVVRAADFAFNAGNISRQVQESIKNAQNIKVDLPDLNKLFTDATRNVGQQLLSASFPGLKPVQAVTNLVTQQSNYKSTVQSSINKALASTQKAATTAVDRAKQLGSSIFNTVSSSISNLFRR